MAQDRELERLLRQHLHDPSSAFSVGSFGAIAEFHRAAEEPLTLDDPSGLAIATARGGLKFQVNDAVIPLAYETLSGRPGGWHHGVVFCLPEALAASSRRTVLTELGPDRDALKASDRDDILFDLGLGARNVEFCVRTGDPALLAVLRAEAGRSVFAPGSRVMPALIEASPHRVVLSRIARAEVYQAIGTDTTPDGPHTHVLPKFLKGGRTHSANIPVPRGALPCLSLYPAHPLFDGIGRRRPFDPARLESFQRLVERWGDADYRAEKARVMAAIRDGRGPSDYENPRGRVTRAALRIALRQLRHSDGDNPLVQAWSRHFDAAEGRRT